MPSSKSKSRFRHAYDLRTTDDIILSEWFSKRKIYSLQLYNRIHKAISSYWRLELKYTCIFSLLTQSSGYYYSFSVFKVNCNAFFLWLLIIYSTRYLQYWVIIHVCIFRNNFLKIAITYDKLSNCQYEIQYCAHFWLEHESFLIFLLEISNIKRSKNSVINTFFYFMSLNQFSFSEVHYESWI